MLLPGSSAEFAHPETSLLRNSPEFGEEVGGGDGRGGMRREDQVDRIRPLVDHFAEHLPSRCGLGARCHTRLAVIVTYRDALTAGRRG